MLANARAALAAAFAPKHLGFMLVGLVLIALVLPDAGAAARFARVRRLASRATAILTGATAFTFFGAVSVEQKESGWVAQRRQQVARELSRVDQLGASLGALERLLSDVRHMPKPVAEDLRTFFTLVRQRADAEMLVAWRATQLAEDVVRREWIDTPIHPEEPTSSNRVFDLALKGSASWVLEKGEGVRSVPTLPQLESVVVARKRLELRLSEVELVLADALKTAFGLVVPSELDQTTKLFAKAITGAVASIAVKRAFPRDVATVARMLPCLAQCMVSASFKPLTEIELSELSERWRVTTVNSGVTARHELSVLAYIDDAELRIKTDDFAARYHGGFRPQAQNFEALLSREILDGSEPNHVSRSHDAAQAPNVGPAKHSEPSVHATPDLRRAVRTRGIWRH